MTATVRFASPRDAIRALEALGGAEPFERGQAVSARFEADVRGAAALAPSVRPGGEGGRFRTGARGSSL